MWCHFPLTTGETVELITASREERVALDGPKSRRSAHSCGAAPFPAPASASPPARGTARSRTFSNPSVLMMQRRTGGTRASSALLCRSSIRVHMLTVKPHAAGQLALMSTSALANAPPTPRDALGGTKIWTDGGRCSDEDAIAAGKSRCGTHARPAGPVCCRAALARTRKRHCRDGVVVSANDGNGEGDTTAQSAENASASKRHRVCKSAASMW